MLNVRPWLFFFVDFHKHTHPSEDDSLKWVGVFVLCCVEDIAASLITTFPCALLFSATSSHDSQQQPAYTLPRPHTQRHLHHHTPTAALPLYCGFALMFRCSSEPFFLLCSLCLLLQEGWGGRRGEHEGVMGFKSPHFTDPNTTDTWYHGTSLIP